MRTLLLASLVMLASAPLATATCHVCLENVVEDCGALATPDCVDSAAYAAGHLPQHLVEEVLKAVDDADCELKDDSGCA